MRFLRFLSLTSATQLVLLSNQLLLLPLQLRIWGQQATAQWFVVIAIANLATLADLGMRSAGHADLLAAVREQRPEPLIAFRQIWALTRAMFVAATTGLLFIQIFVAIKRGYYFEPWLAAVTISVALDTLVNVRGVWLDTLGHFNRVEGVFLGMVGVRMSLSAAALVLFGAPPSILAWIFLATATAGLAVQAVVLNDPPTLRVLAGGFSLIRWRSLAVIRWVVAEPASNWVRLMLPVIVFATFDAPAIVTSYVGLRAAFGVTRQVINQVARFASVRYIQTKEGAPGTAEAFALRAILFCTGLSVAASAAVIADRGRVLGHWLSGSDPALIGVISASFAVGSVAYGYQVVAGVMTRSGNVIGVAVRQYAYLGAGGVAALVGWAARSLETYLVLLALSELWIAVLFIGAIGRQVRTCALVGFACGGACLSLLWCAARVDVGGVFDSWSFEAATWSALAAALTALSTFAACAVMAGVFHRHPA